MNLAAINIPGQEFQWIHIFISHGKIHTDVRSPLSSPPQPCHHSGYYFTYFTWFTICLWGFPGGSDGKVSACNVGDQVQFLGQEDPLEKEMATHSSIPAWQIPWTEEPGRLKYIGS